MYQIKIYHQTKLLSNFSGVEWEDSGFGVCVLEKSPFAFAGEDPSRLTLLIRSTIRLRQAKLEVFPDEDSSESGKIWEIK